MKLAVSNGSLWVGNLFDRCLNRSRVERRGHEQYRGGTRPRR
jgi:hypothetical protein